MPELPEVETTMRGISPYVCDQKIDRFIVRNHQLRWPVAEETANLQGRQIMSVSRRGKYILMHLDHGTLIWHLGMSGSMKIRPVGSPVELHEHIELQLASGQDSSTATPDVSARCSTRHPIRFSIICSIISVPSLLAMNSTWNIYFQPVANVRHRLNRSLRTAIAWSVWAIFTPARPCF